MALGSVRTLATAAFVVTLFVVSTATAQESSKSEESSRETKEEIKSILSDIEARHPSSAPAMIQPLEVRTVSAGGRMAWQPFLPLGVALVLAMLGLVVFRVLPMSPRAKLAVVAAGLVLVLAISVYVTPARYVPSAQPAPASSGENARTSDAEHRMTICLGQLRSPRECSEEETARERRIEEMAEAIRRARR